MNKLNVVLRKDGYYWVGTLTEGGLEAFKVTRDLTCACGGTRQAPCVHVAAVRSYLRIEGQEVPEVAEIPEKAGFDLPDACPICGGAVRPQGDHWRCVASPGHYWQHRGEQSGVKAFLTQPHPAKQGAFYEQTPEEREAFLAQAQRRMVAGGYSPYR